MNPNRRVGRKAKGAPLVVITDDSRLVFSDDYRTGWKWGFETIGCDVRVIDVAELRKSMNHSGIPSPMSMGRNSAAKPIADMIANLEPDLVFAHHGRAASNKMFLDRLRARGVKTACYLCDEPYESGETVTYSPNFDYVFTMDPCTVELHRKSRKGRSNVFYLPPGVHTEDFQPKPYFDKNDDITRELNTLFIGNGTLTPRLRYFEPVNRLVPGACFHYLKKSVAKNKKGWIPYSSHPEWYSNCKIGLNVHRAPWIEEACYKKRVVNRPKTFPVPPGLTLCTSPPATGWGTGFWNDGNLPAAHINPRFLEMAACGTLVISDNHRSELARLFPGAPQASDPDHYLELVLYYLEHLDEAEAIGKKCSYLISRRHSYRHRAAEVLTRLGLEGLLPAAQYSSLGEPADWLTVQDLKQLGVSSSSEPTGPSERWSPRSGMLWTNQSTSPKDMQSVDAPTPWLL
jgi:spore maturation protein CgeB